MAQSYILTGVQVHDILHCACLSEYHAPATLCSKQHACAANRAWQPSVKHDVMMAGSVHKFARSRVPQHSVCALLECSSSSSYCAQAKAVHSSPQDCECHLGWSDTALQRPGRRRGSGICRGVCGEEGPLYSSFPASFWRPGDPKLQF